MRRLVALLTFVLLFSSTGQAEKTSEKKP